MSENSKDKKMYYCEEKQAICITYSCTKGKELLNYAIESQGHVLYDSDGSPMGGITGIIETCLMFKDRTEKTIGRKIGLVNGCGQND